MGNASAGLGRSFGSRRRRSSRWTPRDATPRSTRPRWERERRLVAPLVIRSASEFGRLASGEVPICAVTTPACTPLFARAAAVVTDIGSPSAHAPIIAREYGIPAVVGTADATSRIARNARDRGRWCRTGDSGRAGVTKRATLRGGRISIGQRGRHGHDVCVRGSRGIAARLLRSPLQTTPRWISLPC